jgi:hypothetical protein
MSETIGVNVLRRSRNVEIAPLQDGYSAVRIFVGTNDDGEAVVYEAGDVSGNVLEIKNPFGTQAMANNILNAVRGYQYQPMDAQAALLNPAAEMGDGVTVNGVYTGMFSRVTKFDTLMPSDIKAPTNQEIEHEFAVESPSDRQYTRFVQQVRASLKITNLAIEAEVSARTAADTQIRATLTVHANQIAAKVESDTSAGKSSFGWKLTSNDWSLWSNNRRVLYADRNGLNVDGNITARSGTIGNFNIGNTAIWNNISQYGGTQSTGVYLGTNGIQLGQRFKVDTSGNVTATRLTVDTLVIGGTAVSASTLNSRANSAYSSTTSGGYCYNGASNGNSAIGKWNNAEDSNIGVDIYGTFGGTFNAKSLSLSENGWGAPYKSLGLAQQTISGTTIKYVTWS